MKVAFVLLGASVSTFLSFSSCAVPQSQGQARYDVVVVSVHVAEGEVSRAAGAFGIGPKSSWHAIKVDRYTGETWLLGFDGKWHSIATAPGSEK